MKLTSPSFENNQMMPQKYSCDGEGVNPPLHISDVPQNAKSLVLILDDPDAPSGTFVHWTVWNINPQEALVAERSVPEGSTQGATSTGRPGYVPACPPAGTHRYIFTLYGLDTEFNLPPNTNKSQLEQVMENHILDKTELIGLYQRE